jgi:cobalt/nickel transport system permease protein
MTLAFREAPVPSSPLSRWDARWKLAGLGLFSVGVALLQAPVSAGVAFAIGLALVGLGRLPPRKTLARLGLFALAVSPVLVVFPLVSGWAGFSDAVTIVLRCLAVGAVGLVLVGTAPVHRTLAAARSLGVPGLFVHLSQLTYRYAHLLAAEYRRVRVAMRARGFQPRANGLTYHALGHAAGAVLVRGADRADRVAHAMRARGFDGSYRTLTPFHTHVADVLSFVVAAAGTIGLVLTDRLL